MLLSILCYKQPNFLFYIAAWIRIWDTMHLRLHGRQSGISHYRRGMPPSPLFEDSVIDLPESRHNRIHNANLIQFLKIHVISRLKSNFLHKKKHLTGVVCLLLNKLNKRYTGPFRSTLYSIYMYLLRWL